MDRQRAVPRAVAPCRRALDLVLPGRDVVLALVDDETIAELHGRYLGDPTPTDVLSFPHGEIVVSGDTALREARARGIEPLHELLLYVVHGALHLAGHRDKKPKDRARMRRAEREVLSRLGLSDIFGAPERRRQRRGRVS